MALCNILSGQSLEACVPFKGRNAIFLRAVSPRERSDRGQALALWAKQATTHWVSARPNQSPLCGLKQPGRQRWEWPLERLGEADARGQNRLQGPSAGLAHGAHEAQAAEGLGSEPPFFL